MRRVLVTGATGFLGRSLLPELLGAGYNVVALVRNPKAEDPLFANVTVVKGDLLDRTAVQEAMQGCHGVIHAAGVVSRNPKDSELLYRTNVKGTRVVLEAAAAAGCQRLLFVSSSGVVALSETPSPIPDETAECPIRLINRWPYYRSKLHAEKLCFERADGLEVVAVNPSLLLGPDDTALESTQDIALFLDGKIPAIPGGGLSLVDVRDTAHGVRLAFEKGTPGSRYLLASENMALKEFFAAIARIAKKKKTPLATPTGPAWRKFVPWVVDVAHELGASNLPDPTSVEMAHYFWYADATKAKRELGWVPRAAEETLRDTVASIEAQKARFQAS